MSNESDVQVVDFVAWCSANAKELPVTPEAMAGNTEEGDSKAENRKRTGAKEGLYPPQYFAGQYPALWKVPAAADSVYYQSINKKK